MYGHPHTTPPQIWVSYTSYMGSRDTSPDPARADSSQLPVTCVRDQHTCRHAHSSRVDIRHARGTLRGPAERTIRFATAASCPPRPWVRPREQPAVGLLPWFAKLLARSVEVSRSRKKSRYPSHPKRAPAFLLVQLPPVLLRDPVKAEQRMREQLSGRGQQPKTAHKGAALWLTVARLLAVNERHLSDSVTVPCTRTRDAR